MEMVLVLVAVAVSLGTSLVMALLLARWLLYVVEPGELLVFSGRQVQQPDGSVVGYRVVTAGRAWRIPLLERVDRLPDTREPVVVEVRAQSSDPSEVGVRARASIAIDLQPPGVGAAVERFLGAPGDALYGLASDEISGAVLRTMLLFPAPSTAADWAVVAAAAQAEAAARLGAVGLVVDSLVLEDAGR